METNAKTMRLRMAVIATLIFALSGGHLQGQTTYTWIGGNNRGWTVAADWSPSGPPTSVDTAVGGATSADYVDLLGASVTVANMSIDAAAYAWGVNNTTAGDATLNVTGTITLNPGVGNFTVRSGTAAELTTLEMNNATLNGQDLTLGVSGTASGVELAGVTTTGTVTLNVNTSTNVGSLVQVNSLSDYSMGLIDAVGATTSTSTNTFDLISNPDGTLGAETRTATVTGLTGTGSLTVNGTNSSSVGGNATLNIANGGSTNYTSQAVMENGLSPGTSSLALTVNLTGTGTQTLTGASTFTNGTTITSGTLYASYVPSSSSPVVTTEPANQTVVADGTVTFTVAATGTGDNYAWSSNGTALLNGTQTDGSVVSGVTTATLSISNAQTTDVGPYTVTVTNASGSTSSTPAATLTISSTALAVPTITTEPANEKITVGGTAVFTVVANGTGDTYQWSLGSTPLTDGNGISGSATATLAVTNIQAANAGNYTVVVTNSGLTATSSAATLTVNPLTGSLGSGAVTVQSGATLGGSGTIITSAGNNVVINGTLSPGDLVNPAGTLTLSLGTGSQLVFNNGSYLNLALGTNGGPVAFSSASPGNWLSGSGNWTLNVTEGTGFQLGVPYQVFTNAATASFAPGAVACDGQTLISSEYAWTTDGTNYSIALSGPTITSSPPASTNLVPGGTVNLTVVAAGSGTLAYQWYFNGTALADSATISGATSATLSLTNLQTSEAGSYTCAVTDVVGTVTSPAAALVAGPTIGTEPATTSANAGGTASFGVAATGVGTLTYQWSFNGTALSNGTQADGTTVSGAASATLVLTGVHGDDSGSYSVVVTDTNGPTASSAATLTVNEPPAFTVEPVSVTLAAGQTASFYAPATGVGTVSYQWYLNSVAITNATDAYLLVTPVSSTNAGSYTCVATNAVGSTTSGAAVLTLSASTDLGRLTNVSVRTNCGTGSANIIAGFVIGGSGTDGSNKELLIRADGPELGSDFGVPGFLPDPSLDVFNTSGSSPVSVGQNTGWCVTQTNENQVNAAGSAVYAFPLTTNSASSAIVLTLPSDEYTENVTGASNDTGIALAEVYDVSNATETYSPTIPRLVNVSARANVAPGAGNLIAGFTIGGSTDKTVLVRGTGPGLSEFGLTGLLDQPTLAVYSTSSGDTLVATNTGWDEDSVLTAAANSVYAFAQTSSADCALLVTLPPGTYTANLNSNDGTSGLALVEVYEVP